MLNIGGNKDDRSYRYKMPRLQTKVEGRGNGIKTVIPNMADIAAALHCDPGYPTKFFGIELGAQSKFDMTREVAIVNGRHDAPDLAGLLDKFIDQFVLCPTCKLPEINMHVTKQGSIKVDCRACGHNGVLKTAHKLTTYILNNPPSKPKKGDKDKAEDADKDGKDGKKGKKKGDKDKNDKDSGSDKDEAKDDEPAELPPKMSKETEIEWFSDTSAEATQKRMEAEIEEMKSSKKVDAILTASKAALADTPVEHYKQYVADGDHDVNELVGELRRLQLARGFDDRERINVMLGAVIDLSKPKLVPGLFAKNAKLFRSFVTDKAAAFLFIGGIELLLAPKCAAVMPHVIKSLYEADVLQEEWIVGWFESPVEASPLTNKKTALELRKSVKPIVEWLQNADEEESDDDDA